MGRITGAPRTEESSRDLFFSPINLSKTYLDLGSLTTLLKITKFTKGTNSQLGVLASSIDFNTLLELFDEMRSLMPFIGPKLA